MKKLLIALLFCLASISGSFAQQPDTYTLFKPDQVFDGRQMYSGWRVIAVEGNPADDIKSVRQVKMVTKDGVMVKE